jgi:hypothetical protein
MDKNKCPIWASDAISFHDYFGEFTVKIFISTESVKLLRKFIRPLDISNADYKIAVNVKKLCKIKN